MCRTEINILCNLNAVINDKISLSHFLNLFLIDNVSEITMADFQLALCHIVPSLYRGLEGRVEWNPVSWEDIGGLQDVK